MLCCRASEECLIDNASEEHAFECDIDKIALNTKVRRLGGFLLTGVIVYQTTRAIGYASIGAAAGATLAGGLMTGGPAGLGAAWLGVLTSAAPAIEAVEVGSLAIGTAASFIPLLP